MQRVGSCWKRILFPYEKHWKAMDFCTWFRKKMQKKQQQQNSSADSLNSLLGSMQPQTSHTCAMFPPPFFCCSHHVIWVCPKIRYPQEPQIHSFIPIFPPKACTSRDVPHFQSHPNNVASELVARFAIVAKKTNYSEPMICLEVSLMWQEFLADYIFVKTCLCEKT